MRRVTITIDEDTLERVHRTVQQGGAPSVSAYFAELAEQHTRQDHLVRLLDQLDADLGAPSAGDVEWARQVTEP